MIKTFLLAIVLISAAGAQPLSFGVKLGVPLSDAYDIASSQGRSFNSDATQYTAGVSAELHLPLGFSVEGNALYSRFHFSSENLVNTLSKANSNSFEFPILGKYKFAGVGPVHAFVGAGPTFRSLQSVLRLRPTSTNDSFGKGIVFAGGVEVKALFLRITPEIRYTRWGTQSFLDAANVLIRGNQNQGQFLLGISF